MNNIDLNSMKQSFQEHGTKKMNIYGKDEIFTVYKIPLDLLFYNDENDRIATDISKYNSEHNEDISKLPKFDKNRNELIEKFIIEGDEDSFKKTKANISQFTQLEAGVVLSDGRVIDGNRRFTCLRRLFSETGDQKFGFFEAAILDKDVDEKQVKILELMLQKGIESRVDYNPIDYLAGLYKVLIKDKKLTVEEYARSINSDKKDVLEEIEVAKLMEDFLEFEKMPEQFYIAKDLDINGPLRDIYNIKKKLKGDPEKWNKARIILYDIMYSRPIINGSADTTRNVRDIGKYIINSKNKKDFEDFYNNLIGISRELHSKIDEHEGKMDKDAVREIKSDKTLNSKMNENLSDAIYKAKIKTAKNKPVEILKSALRDLDTLDLSTISVLQKDSRVEFEKLIDSIQKKISQINEKLNG